MMKIHSHRRIPACLGLVLVVCAASSIAAEQTVWRLGVFNESSGEFRREVSNYADPQEDPTFIVGTSEEARDWVGFQPGPANGMAGGRLHPFTILFDLAHTPRGVFRLKIGILYETQRLSHLHLDINGHTGKFYFHPRLSYAAGDWQGTFVPQTSADTKVIELPAAWLRQGENRLVLTALDDPSEPENALGTIVTGHSGIIYDALEFTQDADGELDTQQISVTATPTIFYRHSAHGLAELVEIYPNFGALPQSGRVHLRINGQTSTQSFESSDDFGELRLAFEVPEWEGTAEGEVSIRAEGRVSRFPVELTAAKKWSLFVVPHQHLDIGFTDYVARVAELQSQVVDDAINLIDDHPDYRYTLDGYWIAKQYMSGRSPEKQERFLQMLREQKIVLPLQYANQHTGTATLEGLIRSLYPSHFFAKKHSIPITHTHITDVPSYSWSYASVLAAARQKYFAAASNNWRAPILLLGRWNEKSPFYWQGPDGGKVLMWYSRAYLQIHTLFGLPPQLTAARDSLPVFLQAYQSTEYKASAAIIYGAQLENTPLEKEQATFPRRWAELYAWPQMVFSSFSEALSEIERQWEGEIKTVRGDFGPYWEDGFGSDALHTAIHRENQQRIMSAEKLSALPTILRPSLKPDREVLERAWENILLFDEHTWTSVRTVGQPEHAQTTGGLAVKRARATEARRQINHTIRRSFAQLESLITPKELSLIVFNSLNWERSGYVVADLNEGIEIVDIASGQPIPYQILRQGKGTELPVFGVPYRRVRFYAEGIPAVGYKVYALRPLDQSGAVTQEARPGRDRQVVESPHYRLTLDLEAGAVASIWDKDLDRELVEQASPYRFGAYLYVTGADNLPHNSLYRYGSGLEPPELTVHPASQGRLVSLRSDPFGTTVVLESQAHNTPRIRTEIFLPNKEKRIDFNYEIAKDYVLTKEAAYFAFPFAAKQPTFTYETQTAWVNPARDELRGGSREWYAANHWAAVQDGEVTAAIIPLDAPLVNFGDIVRGNWPEEFRPASATIFSWIMNNYWQTNFVAGQGGKFSFRYVLLSGREFSPSKLTRIGWEAMTPLESSEVAPFSTGPGILPADQASFLTVDQPDVVLVTWKPAEEGEGSILRLVETAGRARKVRLSSSQLSFTEAWRCSALEENEAPATVSQGSVVVEIKAFEILTLRVKAKPNNVNLAKSER